MATKITVIETKDIRKELAEREEQFGYCKEPPADVLKQLIGKYPIARYKDYSMPLFMNRFEDWHKFRQREGWWGLGIQDSTENFGTTNISLDTVRVLAEQQSRHQIDIGFSYAGRTPYGLSIQVPLIVTGTLNDLIQSLKNQACVERRRSQQSHAESVAPRQRKNDFYETKYVNNRPLPMEAVYTPLRAEYFNYAVELITREGTFRPDEFPSTISLEQLISLDRRFSTWLEAAEILHPDLAEMARIAGIEVKVTEISRKDIARMREYREVEIIGDEKNSNSYAKVLLEFNIDRTERFLAWKR